jgi:hypothetical protein
MTCDTKALRSLSAAACLLGNPILLMAQDTWVTERRAQLLKYSTFQQLDSGLSGLVGELLFCQSKGGFEV